MERCNNAQHSTTKFDRDNLISSLVVPRTLESAPFPPPLRSDADFDIGLLFNYETDGCIRIVTSPRDLGLPRHLDDTVSANPMLSGFQWCNQLPVSEPLWAYGIIDPFPPLLPNMHLEVYQRSYWHRALVIPPSSVKQASLNINLEEFRHIAHRHFAANRRDTEICLVTHIRVAKKVAIDYRRDDALHYCVFNADHQGSRPDNFEIRNGPSNSMQVYGPETNDAEYVFWEQHLRKNRGCGFQYWIPHWKQWVKQGVSDGRTTRSEGSFPEATTQSPSNSWCGDGYSIPMTRMRQWTVTLLPLLPNLWLAECWVDGDVESSFCLEWDGCFDYLQFERDVWAKAPECRDCTTPL